jgi:hypothetical protein
MKSGSPIQGAADFLKEWNRHPNTKAGADDRQSALESLRRGSLGFFEREPFRWRDRWMSVNLL